MKLCFIGCGGQAFHVYADALARCGREGAGVSYAACCDIDLEKAELFRKRAGFERAYADYSEMMRIEKPGAVILATPFAHTRKIAADVLSHPCAIMLEKPLGRDLGECLSIARAVAKAGVRSMAAFNRRFMPLVRFLARELAEGGSPLQHIGYEMCRVDRREDHFYTTAIHGIDLARHIAGADFQSAAFAYGGAGGAAARGAASRAAAGGPGAGTAANTGVAVANAGADAGVASNAGVAAADAGTAPNAGTGIAANANAGAAASTAGARAAGGAAALGVVNTQMQCVFANGVTAQLSFCPTAGIMIERLAAITENRSYFVRLPIWEDSPDMPGCIEKYESGRLAYRKTGLEISDGASMFESNGFYAELKEFFACANGGLGTAHGVETAVEAMRVMDCMRNMDAAYSA
ncbi:MAG: Gfo/Idh/MocA family oxidoreductase [Clostridiales bacterium]|jgi:predicted dehydrogenase|nr:Gfo/Idh/MocA family oxidoreductase [Clostridiales bacterium]